MCNTNFISFRQVRGAGIRTLLAPADGATNFAREYESALQGDPDIAVRHGYVMRELQQR